MNLRPKKLFPYGGQFELKSSALTKNVNHCFCNLRNYQEMLQAVKNVLKQGDFLQQFYRYWSDLFMLIQILIEL